MDRQNIEITLKRAPNDPPERDSTFQTELTAFGWSLRDAGVTYSQRAIAFDSADGGGFPLAEFVIKQLGPPAITGVAAIIGAWVHARVGRKARLKIGDVEAEARTVQEVEQLLRMGLDFRDRTSGPNHDK